jgi:hypothetical protein
MLKTPVAPTLNDVITTHNVRKGKQAMRKLALVAAATAAVTGVLITIANRMENEENSND